MEKLIKTSKTLDVIAKICQIVTIVGIVASLVACALACAGLIFDIDPEMLGEPEYSITLGNQTTLILSEDIELDWNMILGQTAALAAVSAVGLVLIYLFIKTARAILAPMMEGLPFHGTISLNLKKLGWISVAACVYDAVSSIITAVSTSYIYKLPELLGEYVVEVEHTVGINMGYLLAAAVCFLLSYVFTYGQQLQLESDETL